MAAVESGHAEVVQLLIDHHVDINSEAFGNHGSCAIESTQVLGHSGIFRLLVQSGASVLPFRFNENRAHELVSSVECEDLGRISQLVGIGTDPKCIVAHLGLLELPGLGPGLNSAHLKDIDHMLCCFQKCGGKANFQDPHSGKSLLEIALCLLDFNAAKNVLLKGADVMVPRSEKVKQSSFGKDYRVPLSGEKKG